MGRPRKPPPVIETKLCGNCRHEVDVQDFRRHTSGNQKNWKDEYKVCYACRRMKAKYFRQKDSETPAECLEPNTRFQAVYLKLVTSKWVE